MKLGKYLFFNFRYLLVTNRALDVADKGIKSIFEACERPLLYRILLP